MDNKKKILYICQYFNSPQEGGLLRPWEVSRYLVSKGYDVTVMAAAPHHMSGVTDKRLQKKLFYSYTVEGIKVVKIYSYPDYRKSRLSRILYYTIYPLLATVAAFREKKPDLIITSTPPVFLLISGYIVSRLKRKKFIVEVRDAWLEFALARNLVPRVLIEPLKRFQSFMLRQADYIISVTPGIKKMVDEYTGNPSKNLLVMNGYEEDVNMLSEGSEKEAVELAGKYGLDGKFVAVYTGTLGMARDHHIFGRTANYLRNYKDIVFLFIGEGEKKQELMEYCNKNRLTNSVFLPLQPRTMMPVFMRISDVGINSIRKNDALESSLSNKVFDYLGNGLPVVWAGDGDTSEFLEKSGGGLVVKPESEKEMAEAILRLYHDPDLKYRMAQKGRDYVMGNFTRQKVMKSIDPILR